MTVLLTRSYANAPAGNTIQVPSNVETAIIAQGIGTLASTAASAAPTTGAQTTNLSAGRVAIAAAASSVVVTNPLVDVNSKIFAVGNQAAAASSVVVTNPLVDVNSKIFAVGNQAAADHLLLSLPILWSMSTARFLRWSTKLPLTVRCCAWSVLSPLLVRLPSLVRPMRQQPQ